MTLIGQKAGHCFSQSKNELIIPFQDIDIRVGCNTPLTYCIPVNSFARARKNVAELFPEIANRHLRTIRVIDFERTLVLCFDDQLELIIKLHGTSSNILLAQAKKVKALFNTQLSNDWQYEEQSGPYQSSLLNEQVATEFNDIRKQLHAISPIFDKQFARRIDQIARPASHIGEALKLVKEEAMDGSYYLSKDERKVHFTVFPPTNGEHLEIKGVIEALQVFLKLHFQYQNYRSQYKVLEKQLKQPYDKYQKIFNSYTHNVNQLKSQRNPEELGHLLMAHMHEIERGAKLWKGKDFYQEGEISIKLKTDLSPQENAQRYYQKHKERKKRLAYLEGELDDIQQKLDAASKAYQDFLKLSAPIDLPLQPKGIPFQTIQELKSLVQQHEKEIEKKDKRLPFRKFSLDSFEIFVGKSAKNNDLLSFKFAHKEDLWMHAKDVAGSHVIIRHQAGKTIPSHVLEYAASLAAYYSKRKTDSVVPVQYTPKKYIRKRKGDPPGMVVVQKESVILVEPEAG